MSERAKEGERATVREEADGGARERTRVSERAVMREEIQRWWERWKREGDKE